MMHIQPLTDDFAVSAQIITPDLSVIDAAGYKTILCNRPDGESVDQPIFSDISHDAERIGLKTAYVPVVSGQITAEDVRRFEEAVSRMPGPVLAYCRTGTRSAMLWAMSQAGKRDTAEIVETCKSAGYDVSGVVS